MDMMDASDFWDIMDTTEVTREEIVLVASYIVAYWRMNGQKILADTFVKQANIEEVKELDCGIELKHYDMFWKYHDAYGKGRDGLEYWTFYCHEKLMLERQKLETLKQDLEQDTSQEGTQTNPLPLNVDQDNAMFPFPKIDVLCKLSQYTAMYNWMNFLYCYVAEQFVENGDNPLLDPEKANKVKKTIEDMISNNVFGQVKI